MKPEDMATLLGNRRSVRKFSDRKPDKKIVEKIIEMACMAPSASNRQDWFFTVIFTESMKHAMADAVRRRWQAILAEHRQMAMIDEIERYTAGFTIFESAPVIIAVSANRPGEAQNHLLGDNSALVAGSMISAAMAAQNMMLAASAFGLGSCCMTGALAARKELEEIIGLEKKRILICLITVGYAAETPPAPPRKPVAMISRFLE
jgi:coenzyme F420-0:L-glutamate ligase / coenzyme F420-1:gamma-L-glutamate ligase